MPKNRTSAKKTPLPKHGPTPHPVEGAGSPVSDCPCLLPRRRPPRRPYRLLPYGPYLSLHCDHMLFEKFSCVQHGSRFPRFSFKELLPGRIWLCIELVELVARLRARGLRPECAVILTPDECVSRSFPASPCDAVPSGRDQHALRPH